ncbi:MAG: hypothetical protein HC814_04265, partial [Rhodobacteraceae bacterium]|nr:hypothetical protein [Paracoccaceae bacterium]
MSASVVGTVSGLNPTANLVDLISLATITRTALEEDWTKAEQGAAFQPWLKISRALETDAWKLADGVLTPEQQQELKDGIRSWWDDNADGRSTFFARPEQFSTLVRQTDEKRSRPGSVFALVGLDPMAGIDPAVREMALMRLFAERTLYVAQRAPFLLRWQVELLTEDLFQSVEVATVVSNLTHLSASADRLSHAAEITSKTMAQLPDHLAGERKAIVDALEAQEGRLRELSAEFSRTLAAGEKMSMSLNTTLITFDALMKRFGVGERDATPPDTNSPPFNVLDYAQTADRLAIMAKELDIVLKDASTTLDSPALDKRIADLGMLSDRARTDAKSVLNHAFLLAAGLGLFIGVIAIAYRRYTR